MKHLNKNKQQYFKYYTMLFVVAVLLVFSWYFCTGTSFIWQNDGWMQHYKALVYYSRYLRQICYEIFYNHKLIIPAWDFNIGEGNDILATLHYYVIGDPFTIFSVFVPESLMYIYYEGILILRMYFAGIAFSYFCFKTGRTSHYAVIAGSITYVFCYWVTFNVVRHPYFLNPVIYLPFLLTGIEKILKKERPYLFTPLYNFWVALLQPKTFCFNRLMTRFIFKSFSSVLTKLTKIICSCIFSLMKNRNSWTLCS